MTFLLYIKLKGGQCGWSEASQGRNYSEMILEERRSRPWGLHGLCTLNDKGDHWRVLSREVA